MNRVAVITGGSRGIGSGIAKTLSKGGYKVALTYNRNSYLGCEVQDEIKSKGGEAIAIQMTIEDRKNVRDAFKKIRKYYEASISILINNAAIAQEKPFEEITDNDWERMLKINLHGPFICSQEVLSEMIKERWGRIINITSIGGQWGGYNQVHYAAAKAALINLTKSLAKIYSGEGVLTNAVAIGLAKTDMSAVELESDGGKTKVTGIPIGRIATVDEIANTVNFLCSDDASYITGQTINVNGGMYF